MYQFYPLVIIIQAFCLYHAYKNKANQKWFWFIIILPLIGCGFYLYDHFYNKENISTITEGVKGMVNSNYELEKLEQKFNLTDSDLNKSLLADKYLELGRYTDAIPLYESCLSGSQTQPVDVLKSLVQAHYLNEEYADAVKYGDQIKDHKEFNKSEEKVAYAWALNQLGETEQANHNFAQMDSRFNNYTQRIEYAKFMVKNERKQEAIDHLSILLSEFDQMLPQERKEKRAIQNLIKNELRVLSVKA